MQQDNAPATELPPVASYVLLADSRGAPQVYLERRGYHDEDYWAIARHGFVLDREHLDFVYEGMPSGRTEEHLKATRFTLAEALVLWKEVVGKPEMLQYGTPRYAYGRPAA